MQVSVHTNLILNVCIDMHIFSYIFFLFLCFCPDLMLYIVSEKYQTNIKDMINICFPITQYGWNRCGLLIYRSILRVVYTLHWVWGKFSSFIFLFLSWFLFFHFISRFFFFLTVICFTVFALIFLFCDFPPDLDGKIRQVKKINKKKKEEIWKRMEAWKKNDRLKWKRNKNEWKILRKMCQNYRR